ncbi:MAG: hypothetical protein KAJ14_04290 [Candidatus Omnitrophica bacterium]|nr:hypothetical protein [Candidatus Omnitrophota bacterium]
MGIFGRKKYNIVVKSITILLVYAFVLMSAAPAYALDKIIPADKVNLSPAINISNNEMLEVFKMQEGITSLLNTVKQQIDKNVRHRATAEYEKSLQKKVEAEERRVKAASTGDLNQTIPVSGYASYEAYLVAVAARLNVLLEDMGEDELFKNLDKINEHAQATDLVKLDGTPGLERIIRRDATDEKIAAYFKSLGKGEWMDHILAGGDATRLGLNVAKLMVDLRELLNPVSEESLAKAIQKAKNKDKPEITQEQIEMIGRLKFKFANLRDTILIGRILESKSNSLSAEERVKQTITICPSKGNEEELAETLYKNNYFGFAHDNFIIQPQVKNPMFTVDKKTGKVKIAKGVVKAGGNGVSIIETELQGKSYAIDSKGNLKPLKVSTLEYAKSRGVKFVAQRTIGDLRTWVESPWNEKFLASVHEKLDSKEIGAAAENVKQNPAFPQKGGTVMYNRKTGKVVFIEKLSMGRLFDQLNEEDYIRQPLATFNHAYRIDAFQETSDSIIPLYVCDGGVDADGNRVFTTEIVGGDRIMTALQEFGYDVAHVERNIEIRELKGTASLIPAIIEALLQDDRLVKAEASKLAGNIREEYAVMVNNMRKLKEGDVSVIASINEAINEIASHLDGKAEYYPIALRRAFNPGKDFKKHDIKVLIQVIMITLDLVFLEGKVSTKTGKKLDEAMEKLKTSLAALDAVANYNDDLLYTEMSGEVLLDLSAMLNASAAEAEKFSDSLIEEAEVITYLERAI